MPTTITPSHPTRSPSSSFHVFHLPINTPKHTTLQPSNQSFDSPSTKRRSLNQAITHNNNPTLSAPLRYQYYTRTWLVMDDRDMGWNVSGYILNHRWLLSAGPSTIPPPQKGPVGLPMLPLIQAHLRNKPIKFPLIGPPGEKPKGVTFASAPLLGRKSDSDPSAWDDMADVVSAAATSTSPPDEVDMKVSRGDDEAGEKLVDLYKKKQQEEAGGSGGAGAETGGADGKEEAGEKLPMLQP